jgi:ABC-2 type transport system permease protein
VVDEKSYHSLILSPIWLVSIATLAPLLTMLTVGLSIIISSRVRDANTAQQLGSLILLPLIGILAGQMLGVLNSSVRVIAVVAAVLLLLDVVVLTLAVHLFKREEILTTWR